MDEDRRVRCMEHERLDREEQYSASDIGVVGLEQRA
jgi:hypothetical protein